MKNAIVAPILLLSMKCGLAQSTQMTDPDILGFKLGMSKAAVTTLIKQKFPNASLEQKNIDVAVGGAELYIPLQFKVKFNKLTANTADDTLMINFLPDETVIGLQRTIHYVPQKQMVGDVNMLLTQKYGKPVYYVYDDSSRFANQLMWSDRMLPGLTLVGSEYVQRFPVNTSDFGSVTPYPVCGARMEEYAGPSYNPRQIYFGLTDASDFARNLANQSKPCGKVLWVTNNWDFKYPNGVISTSITLVDLSAAPDRFIPLPSMIRKNPQVMIATPVKEMPRPSAATPTF